MLNIMPGSRGFALSLCTSVQKTASLVAILSQTLQSYAILVRLNLLGLSFYHMGK